jgi:hypothetical protein
MTSGITRKFLISGGPSGKINANVLTVGDGTDTDKTVSMNNGAANMPSIRYNAASNIWQFTNNGTTWQELLSSARVPSKAQVNKNYYSRTESYNNGEIQAGIDGINVAAIAPFSVILWTGSIGTIPAGFVLCNGSNSTPDLRDKFVIAAGQTYTLAQTGGSNAQATSSSGAHLHTIFTTLSGDHTHSIGFQGLAGAHDHGGVTGDYGSNVITPAHQHTVPAGLLWWGYDSTNMAPNPNPTIPQTHDAAEQNRYMNGTNPPLTSGSLVGYQNSSGAGGNQPHNHSIPFEGSHTHPFTGGASGTHSHGGSTSTDGAHTHNLGLPVFHALAFIMKTPL